MKKAEERVSLVPNTQDSALPAASEVEAYLKANPDFFRNREEPLCELEVPHRAGAATSLVERQVSLLRERNIDMRHKLKDIVQNARDNDHLFHRTRIAVLNMLENAQNDALDEVVCTQLRQEVGADFVCLRFFDEANPQSDAPASLTRSGAYCGPLKAPERDYLFADSADSVESAAVVSLIAGGNTLGLLAVGSSDPSHFASDVGTLFLEFIADVIARLR